MAITRTAMVDDDGTGTTGTVINNAWKQQFYDQIDAALAVPTLPGAWIAVPFSASDYAASGGGTWTVAAGNVSYFKYQLFGKTMMVGLYLNATTIAGTVNWLTIKVPGGATANGLCAGASGRMLDGAGGRIAAFLYANAASLTIERIPYNAFPAGNLQIICSLTFEVQ